MINTKTDMRERGFIMEIKIRHKYQSYFHIFLFKSSALFLLELLCLSVHCNKRVIHNFVFLRNVVLSVNYIIIWYFVIATILYNWLCLFSLYKCIVRLLLQLLWLFLFHYFCCKEEMTSQMWFFCELTVITPSSLSSLETEEPLPNQSADLVPCLGASPKRSRLLISDGKINRHRPN